MVTRTYVPDTFIDGTFVTGTFVAVAGGDVGFKDTDDVLWPDAEIAWFPSAVGGVDTENKRRSAPNIIILITMPVAGTANSINNRKHSCWLYRGPGDDPVVAGGKIVGSLASIGVGI